MATGLQEVPVSIPANRNLYWGEALSSNVAKHKGKGRRKMGRYIRGVIDAALDLGTLASKTAVLVGLSQVNERTLVSSIVSTHSISDWTPSVGVGPVLIGVAHGDYSLVEINEYLEQTDSWDEGNKIQQEVSKRLIRRIGTLGAPAAGNAQDTTVLNDGKPIKTKLNWIINQGQSLSLFAYNQGDQPFATSDPDYTAVGHANLWPK